MPDATSLQRRLETLRRASEREPPTGDRLPATVVRTIRDQGLWKLWVPKVYGGAELDLPASLALFEAAGVIDGSIGFAIAIGTGGGLFAAYLPEDTARRIFSPDDALIAGSGAPTGTATPSPGGFRVNGRWQYASLIRDATWVTVSTRRSDTGAVMAVAAPAALVGIIEDWDVHALRATDSQSIEMRDLEVPASHTFSLAAPPRLPTPLYRFPFDAIAAASFAAVAVGIARGAVDAFATRLRDGAEQTPGDAARAQRLARGTGLQQAARSHLMSTAAAGMSLLRDDDRFSRCWRDVHGLAQHAYLSRVRESELGARLARL